MRSYLRSDEQGTMFLGDSHACICSVVHGYICRQCVRIHGLLVSPSIAVWIFDRRYIEPPTLRKPNSYQLPVIVFVSDYAD